MQSRSQTINHKFAVAPMLDWTDRHCRYFLRQLSTESVLYTEMVTTGAILHGKGDYLAFDDAEHPIVLQLGGSDPEAMSKCAVIAQTRGYDEININVGCPSDRVKNGSFGACLMATPEIVAHCVDAMTSAVDIPITVKCRIGIDDMDDDAGLFEFVDKVQAAGCLHFIIHARKAWLNGLSPKQNRDIPPLNYQRVYDLKKQFPQLKIGINGGIKSIDSAVEHLQYVDGVMLGREVYTNPYIIADVDHRLFALPQDTTKTREQVVSKMTAYAEQEVSKGAKVWFIARHMLGLFHGQPGGKIWRRYLTQECPKQNTNPSLLLDALAQVKAAQEKALTFSQNN
ncbi:MAG: tRNA dihydrouridine(20/20a) synthase DusA [Pseudomonadota bacterium]